MSTEKSRERAVADRFRSFLFSPRFYHQRRQLGRVLRDWDSLSRVHP